MNRNSCQRPCINSIHKWNMIRSEAHSNLPIQIHLTRWNGVGRTWNQCTNWRAKSNFWVRIICVRLYASDANFCHEKWHPELFFVWQKKWEKTNRRTPPTRIERSAKLDTACYEIRLNFSLLRARNQNNSNGKWKSMRDSSWRGPVSHLHADTKMHVNNVHHVITFHKT